MKLWIILLLLLPPPLAFLSYSPINAASTVKTTTSINGNWTARYWPANTTTANMTGSGVCGSFPNSQNITVTHCGFVFPILPIPEFVGTIIGLVSLFFIVYGMIWIRRLKR